MTDIPNAIIVDLSSITNGFLLEYKMDESSVIHCLWILHDLSPLQTIQTPPCLFLLYRLFFFPGKHTPNALVEIEGHN